MNSKEDFIVLFFIYKGRLQGQIENFKKITSESLENKAEYN